MFVLTQGEGEFRDYIVGESSPAHNPAPRTNMRIIYYSEPMPNNWTDECCRSSHSIHHHHHGVRLNRVCRVLAGLQIHTQRHTHTTHINAQPIWRTQEHIYKLTRCCPSLHAHVILFRRKPAWLLIHLRSASEDKCARISDPKRLDIRVFPRLNDHHMCVCFWDYSLLLRAKMSVNVSWDKGSAFGRVFESVSDILVELIRHRWDNLCKGLVFSLSASRQ